MRPTIGRKLGLGIGILLLFFLVSGVVFYIQMEFINKRVKKIVDVDNPVSAAAYNMETNATSAEMGVLKYLETGDSEYRKEVERGEARSEKFMAEHNRLAKTQKEKEFGKNFSLLYQEYNALSKTLMDKKDNQEALFVEISEGFEKIDAIIDAKIQARIDQKKPDGLQKAAEAAQLEADIAGVGTWVGNYRRTLKEEYKRRIFNNAKDFEEHLARFKKLRLTNEEKQWAGELEKLFKQTMYEIQELLALEDFIRGNVRKFLDLRKEISNILGKEIGLTQRGLNAAKVDVQQALSKTWIVILVVIIISFLIGNSVIITISGYIVKSIQNLVEGANKIGRGDLDHRIEVTSRDEIGELTVAFNQMTEKRKQAEEALRRAKEELELRVEERTKELVEVNEELKDEIAERKRAEEALHESEKRYATLAELVPQLVWTTEPDGYVDYFNQRWYEYTGTTPEETLGWGWQSVLHPADRARTIELWTTALQTSKPVTVEYRLRSEDGTYRWFLGRGTPLKDEQGHTIKWFGTCTGIDEQKRVEEALQKVHNELEIKVQGRTAELLRVNEALQSEITERKLIEEALREAKEELELRVKERTKELIEINEELKKEIEWRNWAEKTLRSSEERYRLLYEENPSMYFTVNREGRVLSVNQYGAERLGFSTHELIGQSVLNIVYEDDKKAALGQINECFEKPGRFIHREFRKVHKDGSITWVQEIARAVENADGNEVALIVSENVTERKWAEEELRENEERLSAIYNYASVGIGVCDLDGRFMDVNQDLCNISGYSREELLTLRFQDLTHPDNLQADLDQYRRLKTGELKTYKIEKRYVRKDGSIIWVNASISLVHGAWGEPDYAIRIIENIAERKRAEEQIKKSLQEKEMLLREIHHRVKNNLQVISSLLNLQSRGIEDEKVLEELKESRDRISSMALIHENLYQSENLMRVDFVKYTKNLTNHLFRSHGTDSKIKLKIDVNNASLDIEKAIPCGLIINELVSNSLKHAFPKGSEGEIYIGLHLDNGSPFTPQSKKKEGVVNNFTLIVSNNGTEFPKGLDFRNTKSLGLQLVCALTKQLEGTIELDTSRRTEFRIVFTG